MRKLALCTCVLNSDGRFRFVRGGGTTGGLAQNLSNTPEPASQDLHRDLKITSRCVREMTDEI